MWKASGWSYFGSIVQEDSFWYGIRLIFTRPCSQTSGAAAEDDAASKKSSKYENLMTQGHRFQPLAFENMGSWSKETKVLCTGGRWRKASGDVWGLIWYLDKRIAIAIQRGNAAKQSVKSLTPVPYITR